MLMNVLKLLRGLSAALVCVAPVVMAQTQSPAHVPHRADPLDPKAPVPSAVYQSPLNGYRGMGADSPTSWITANETVNRIGGWRAYAREAQTPETTPSGVSTSSPTVPGTHDRH